MNEDADFLRAMLQNAIAEREYFKQKANRLGESLRRLSQQAEGRLTADSINGSRTPDPLARAVIETVKELKQ
jgi:phage shock protein A